MDQDKVNEVVKIRKKLPEEIKNFLADYQKNNVSKLDCILCSSDCCRTGGFALLENVKQIYRLYKAGLLEREDYQFEAGLNFKQFCFKYFDIVERNISNDDTVDETILFFHMRSITKDNNLISVPLGKEDYWVIRDELYDGNPWMNYGCVFLNKKFLSSEYEDVDNSRKCILHTDDFCEVMTAKPIDCLFFTCNDQKEYRTPDPETTLAWLKLLYKHFPDTAPKFKRMIGYDKPDAD